MNTNTILETIKNKVKDFGTIIYVTKFGSHLYGANTENSDMDYYAVYVPFLTNVILENFSNDITISTGNNSSKNTKDDIDVKIISLQDFFKKLRKGDTNKIDLLFSPSNKDTLLFNDGFVEKIYNNRYKLITNTILKTGVFGYSYKQWKKYGVKGTGLYSIEFILNYIKENQISNNVKLREYIFDLEREYKKDISNKSLKFDNKGSDTSERVRIVKQTYKNGFEDTFLEVNKIKRFSINSKTGQMVQSLKGLMNKYGWRSKESMNNDFIDFKALSHSFRMIFMVNEFIETGDIKFPLRNSEFLKDIKRGKFEFDDLFNRLTTLIEEVETKVNKSNNFISEEDFSNNMKKILFGFYGLGVSTEVKK